MRYEALVESKSDVDKLIRYADEKLQELEAIHLQHSELTKPDEKGVVHLTREVQNLGYEFDLVRDQLGKYLEDELAAITKLLWKKITRPDEQHKFTRMRNSLEKMIQAFLGDYEDPYDADRISPHTDPEEYVKSTLKTLQYLKNYWHRIERYQAVEREIKHGPFLLVNEYGYQPGEYDRELGYFDEAAIRVGKMGFKDLLYGKVVLTTTHALGENTIGMYDDRTDEIYLAVDWVNHVTPRREQPVPTLIHEFGHRLWRKFLSAQSKEFYVMEYGWLPGTVVEEWWEILVANNFSLAKTVGHPDWEMMADEIARRWKKAVIAAKKYYHITAKEMRMVLAGKELPIEPGQARIVVTRDVLMDHLERAFYELDYFDSETTPHDYYETKGFTPQSVTWYGKTNPEEDFCEAFMFFCMGWEMKKTFENRLLATLSGGNPWEWKG